MSHWILRSLENQIQDAIKTAQEAQIYLELLNTTHEIDKDQMQRIASGLEIAVLDLVTEAFNDNNEALAIMRKSAGDAFILLRASFQQTSALEDARSLLRMGALAVLGDKSADIARQLRTQPWPELPIASHNWGERTWAIILDIWLRLIRKQGWNDRDIVLERVLELRNSQKEFEQNYLTSFDPVEAKVAALELIGLYHLAKAAEIFALYITDGVVDKNFQVRYLLEIHFDRALEVCDHAQMINLEPLTHLLSACAKQLVENSIWTVTRSVNSRVTQFVRTLVDHGRGNHAIFDVLPPQRRALAEQGLLGSSRRAVVVSLPTSSGKTLIAQFRILQALNQFDRDNGWVAYLVPTRALANQVARQLRRDFNPLGIIVEQASPALELDTIEKRMLEESTEDQQFRVLITTPEKFDLIIRQGWEAKLGRPLSLVVVDEAHTIQDLTRGLKLELLLATINKECEHAQFLLLTPFIQNAREVARWLGGMNSEDISLALDWQPNDRIIGIVQAQKTTEIKRRSFDYTLAFDSVHTTRNTLALDLPIHFPNVKSIASTFAQVNQQSELAAVFAHKLQQRGPVIVMHSRPDWVWSLAEKIKKGIEQPIGINEDIELVKTFIKLELGETFPLISLLDYGIGVHHGGIPEDIRMLIEWLFENENLQYLVATTTIAQGVNFPINGVVLASHQYAYGENMSPEDFWNIAGRAGRVSQGQLGIIALVADSDEKAMDLKGFINTQTGNLNSALVSMALEAKSMLHDLGAIVYNIPKWSSFLQYLAHTYRQMGEPETFFSEIELVLRGTFGFEKLRSQYSRLAQDLLQGIERYIEFLQKPNQPLKLVDSTGFSLQSIITVLGNKGSLNETSWNENTLFSRPDPTLPRMMGILLQVPELRENLEEVLGGKTHDGKKLSDIIKDWVNGDSIITIAQNHFMEDSDKDLTKAITKCSQNLFGRLTHTASWGLGALLTITASDLPDEQFQKLSNLPSQIYYGVNTNNAIILRMLGIPRSAAHNLAQFMQITLEQPLPQIRDELSKMDISRWNSALGEVGKIYHDIWKILEGIQ